MTQAETGSEASARYFIAHSLPFGPTTRRKTDQAIYGPVQPLPVRAPEPAPRLTFDRWKESNRETIHSRFACADAHLGDGSLFVPRGGTDEQQCDLPQPGLVSGRSRVVLSLLAGLGRSLL